MKPRLRKHLPKILLLVLLVCPLVASAEANWMEKALSSLVTTVFGFFVTLSAGMLDWALQHFVIEFGNIYNNQGIGDTIDTLWISVRDIFNITFIFGLIYIGFKMILKSDDSNTRRWLVMLIMAALLVNFSLFFTKVVIDVSNMLAAEIAMDGFVLVDDYPSIGATFMDNVGLSSVLSPEGESLIDLIADSEDGGALTYIFGTMILFIVTTFVFAAGAMLLFIRYAVLLIYMVLSPFMFIGWVLPQLQRYTHEFWHGFLGRAFFAPLYILMVYLSMQIMYIYYVRTTGAEGADLAGAMDGGNAGVEDVQISFAPFILASIFMVASLVIANKLGAVGASTAIGVGKSGVSKLKRGATKTARWTGRTASAPVTKTAGWGARKASYALGGDINRTLENWQSGQRGKMAQKLSSTVTVNDAMQGAASGAKNAKFGLKYTEEGSKARSAEIEQRKETQRAHTIGAEVQRNRDALAAKSTNEIYDPNTGKTIDQSTLQEQEIQDIKNAQEQALANMQNRVANMSVKQLEEMANNNPEIFESTIGHLSDNQFEKLQDSDKLDVSKKNDLAAKRTQAIMSDIQAENGEIITDKLKNMSTKQLETLGSEFIRNNAADLTQSQMDDLGKSNKFTGSQKGSFTDSRKKQQINRAESDDENERTKLFKHVEGVKDGVPQFTAKKPAEIAQLPLDVFKQGDNVKQVDSSVLEEIYNKKTMTKGQRDELVEEIMKNGSDDAKNYITNTELGKRNWGTGKSAKDNESPIVDSKGNNFSSSQNDYGRFNS